ncbi:MAG: 3-deoxy-8-phosphooctulonate synthase [Desulfobacteraceae bacterium]|jgi:2-dehydro-3-deoxyphosphooctonate aldolase (KDO 8-P synthase)
MENRPETDKNRIGREKPLTIIAGPCVIEDRDTTFEIAAFLKKLTEDLDLPFIFKASFDKANRTSIQSYRGPGLEKGLAMLSQIKAELAVRTLSDVHEAHQVEAAAEVLDVIQIPAFLCRQTDFLLAAAKSGRPINIKKGQFLAPWEVVNIIDKIRSTGNKDIVLTERGTMFGYNNLVVDFRGIPIMQSFGCPVIFDATHSVQLPGGAGGSSGGQREHAPTLARAAVAAGADGIFLEVHPNPDKALCDGPNSLPLDALEPLLQQLKSISQAIRP